MRLTLIRQNLVISPNTLFRCLERQCRAYEFMKVPWGLGLRGVSFGTRTLGRYQISVSQLDTVSTHNEIRCRRRFGRCGLRLRRLFSLWNSPRFCATYENANENYRNYTRIYTSESYAILVSFNESTSIQ